MTFERNVVHISAGLDQADYATHFRKLFYTSPKQYARKLFDTLEEKLSDDRVVFPSILTTDTIYAILNGVDLKKEENQSVLIGLIHKDANVRNFLFRDAFWLSNIALPEKSTTVSSITLDDLRLSKKEEKKIFGDAKLSYDIYLGYNSTQRSNLGSQVNSKGMVSRTLKKHVPLKVDPILFKTRAALQNLLKTDIEFAFNLLSETPVFDGVNATLLVGIANKNPGAALGILWNPNLNTIISKAQAETIFANLLNKSRDKKVTPILNAYVRNLINATPAPEFAAVQLQTLFNHPSRIAEELKIPTALLEKYWNEGNFEDKSDENKANFLKANDPTNPKNPRKKHWFRNWFPNWNKDYFAHKYTKAFVEIKLVAAVPPPPAPPPPAVETAEEIREKQARARTARVAELAARKAAAERENEQSDDFDSTNLFEHGELALEEKIDERGALVDEFAKPQTEAAPRDNAAIHEAQKEILAAEVVPLEKERNEAQKEVDRLEAETNKSVALLEAAQKESAAEVARLEDAVREAAAEVARREDATREAVAEAARLIAKVDELAQNLEKDVALFEAAQKESDANIARIEREVQKREREEVLEKFQRAQAAAAASANTAETALLERVVITQESSATALPEPDGEVLGIQSILESTDIIVTAVPSDMTVTAPGNTTEQVAAPKTEETQRADEKAAAKLIRNIAELITRKRKEAAAEIKPIPAPPPAPLLPTFETNEQIQTRHASKRAARLADLAEKKRVQQPVTAAVAPASTTKTAEAERDSDQSDNKDLGIQHILGSEEIIFTAAHSTATASADTTETAEQRRGITEALQKRITAAVAAQKEASAKHEQAETERKKIAEELANDVARLTAEAKAAEETTLPERVVVAKADETTQRTSEGPSTGTADLQQDVDEDAELQELIGNLSFSLVDNETKGVEELPAVAVEAATQQVDRIEAAESDDKATPLQELISELGGSAALQKLSLPTEEVGTVSGDTERKENSSEPHTPPRRNSTEQIFITLLPAARNTPNNLGDGGIEESPVANTAKQATPAHARKSSIDDKNLPSAEKRKNAFFDRNEINIIDSPVAENTVKPATLEPKTDFGDGDIGDSPIVQSNPAAKRATHARRKSCGDGDIGDSPAAAQGNTDERPAAVIVNPAVANLLSRFSASARVSRSCAPLEIPTDGSTLIVPLPQGQKKAGK